MQQHSLPLDKLVPEYRHKIWFIRKYFLDRIKVSLRIADIKDKEVILDVGCGEAVLLKEINKMKKNIDYFGVDINENIRSLSLYYRGEFRVCNIQNGLPFQNECFDVVFALDVLEHINNIEKVLKEVFRVLKSQGRFVVCGPTESMWYKFCRFLIKGTFSSKHGPSSGEHVFSIYDIFKKIEELGLFIKKKTLHLPSFLPKNFAGVLITLYVKK
ncbi:MAG: methyltransferase domain-containing protein [Endomicrobiia bacterium]